MPIKFWKNVSLGLLSMLCTSLLFKACAQDYSPSGLIKNTDYDKKLHSLLKNEVPIIGVESLFRNFNSYLILDAREKVEFDVSHIAKAKHIGYDSLELSVLDNVEKGYPIVVYCSVGYRSERVVALLREEGFTEVYNLYGSIFEWANRGFPLYSREGKTDSIHVYNKTWGKWMSNSAYQKVY